MAFHSRVLDGAVEKPVLALQERMLGVPITDRNFREISLRHDKEDRIFWCFMDQTGRPSYTYSLGAEIQQVQDWIANNYTMPANGGPDDLRYFVCGSKTPGIYNLGGDLRHFAECIRNRDLAAMRTYAETCVRMQYANANSFGAPIITMALVQGDALGGGFEHALAFDILVAERSARMGLPEIIFNLFPGMGAYSFLLRRVGRKVAENFILEGKIHTAEELHELGIVDILVEDGQGEAAIIDYCQRGQARFAAERAVYLARRVANPVELEELLRITNIWAETAMTLSEADVRKMERLADAQERRIQRSLKVVT
ncbi:crotonase/enoyl-CoA hydratase family protein [Sphingorhabdus lacus]|uniref:Enoyl-CoA hydratase n=1 Tax=Sphingorhabdus lacus TaxID=392610 RepID=A0A6I6L781_9SPHN|nr:crotonase/enoyl-CoA hydratase family protein [Sphingorhabdus lacus]QGY79937.1 enoyl-CoA hydratase [Sphingorhabdus lacus]